VCQTAIPLINLISKTTGEKRGIEKFSFISRTLHCVRTNNLCLFFGSQETRKTCCGQNANFINLKHLVRTSVLERVGREVTKLIDLYYIPKYAQISSVNLYLITATCFGVNTPSSGSLQVYNKQEPEVGSCLLRTIHTPNQELHMRPHLSRFYYNSTQLYCILSF
jgi:hypothetical protein